MEASRPDVFSSRKRSAQQDFSYRGVRRRSWGRFVSEIRIPGTKARVWLGSFVSAEMAARAYDTAAFFLRGSSATLNFPELATSLPRPDSASRRDIQRAAAKAAATVNFSPRVSDRIGSEPDSVCSSGEFWDLDEEILSFFDEGEEAPSHSSIRFESQDGFLPQFDVKNYNRVLGDDCVAFEPWFDFDDGSCNGLVTWSRVSYLAGRQAGRPTRNDGSEF